MAIPRHMALDHMNAERAVRYVEQGLTVYLWNLSNKEIEWIWLSTLEHQLIKKVQAKMHNELGLLKIGMVARFKSSKVVTTY